MPDKKSPGDSSPPEKSGGPKKLIMSAGICLVAVAVGFVVGGKFAGGAPAEADGAEGEAVVEEEAAPAVGTVLDLDAVNINLADGRYLRVAVSLGLSEEVHLEGSHGEEVAFPVAPAADVVLSTFSGLEMAQLATAEGRESARLHLVEALEPFYGSDVVTVFYTEFVMQ